jgi:hypothetical protein
MWAMKAARLAFYTLTITIVVTTILGGSSANAADDCDRDCLRGFITRYLDAMVAHTPGALPVSPTMRFTETTWT